VVECGERVLRDTEGNICHIGCALDILESMPVPEKRTVEAKHQQPCVVCCGDVVPGDPITSSKLGWVHDGCMEDIDRLLSTLSNDPHYGKDYKLFLASNVMFDDSGSERVDPDSETEDQADHDSSGSGYAGTKGLPISTEMTKVYDVVGLNE